MLVVIALGGNALRRTGTPGAVHLRASVRLAAQALAPVAAQHQLVIGHGAGPQAGLLAMQGAANGKDGTAEAHAPGAGHDSECLIGYMLEQELGNLLPFERPFATILTMVEVDPNDPAFNTPTQVVGSAYSQNEAEQLTADKKWTFSRNGDCWQRVVACPEPKRIFELRPINWLLEHNTIVIATGGGGIPTMYERGADRTLLPVDCLIDNDLASELLARQLGADLLIMVTDADAVYLNWGTPAQAAIRRASPAALEAFPFEAGSIGLKVKAACRFAKATGHRAAIGALADLSRILGAEAGTTISTREPGIVLAAPLKRATETPQV
jgi:carbamate kinase